MIDVAIIGAGPVGLLLGNLLGQRGHSVTVLEKQPAPYPMPRAIHFDGETMRVFQATGMAQEILAHTHIGKGMLFKNAAGETLIDWSRAQDIGPMGWFESYRFYQPGLEAALRKGLSRFDDVVLHNGAEVAEITQTTDDTTLTLADGRTLKARYAIGCDGTGSVTRNSLGIGLHDLGFQERWLVADLLLTNPQVDPGDYSIQFCDPDAPATYVRGAGDWRRWEMRLREGEPDQPSDAAVWGKLTRWISPNDAKLERAAVYTFRSRIAMAWQQGRVFLAGDSAHQTPPFMGQGMCAGVRDAANLAWKLSAVLNGVDARLLASYQSEREPNARAFIEKTVALGRLINQTAAGHLPTGKMESLWPDLGSGLGPRDGIGGALVPQVRVNGQLADDAMQNGFYILAETDYPGSLPCVTGAIDWLRDKGVPGVIVRPDGYCLTGFADAADLAAKAQIAADLNAHLTKPLAADPATRQV